MKSLKLIFFAFLIANLLSCRGTSSHAAIEQRDGLDRTDKQARIYREKEKERKVETSADRKQTIHQIRNESYEKALENLKLSEEYNPNSEVIMKNLLEYQEQTFAIFDGCVNYRLDGNPPNNISRDEWEEEGWRSHYQYFPERAQYTRIYPVEAQKYLIALSCWTGPYWVATAYYLYDISETLPQVRSLILPTYDRTTNRVIPGSSNINYGFDEYDAENRTLSLWHKYSGMGFCGMQATYLLENNEWILTEFREQEECDGTAHISEDFPLLYP